MLTPTTLLVSTDVSLIDSVAGIVSSIGTFRLDVAEDIDRACSRVGRGDVLIVLVHLEDGDRVAEVIRLLQVISLTGASVVTLVIAEHHHAQQALTLMRLGVDDYLSRPLNLSRLAYLIDILTVEARHDARRLTSPVESLDDEVPFLYCPETGMGRLVEQIRRVAPLETTILLGGETGTGKTQLAGVIHRLSPRRDKPFLAINCGSLSASLIESEMFGHVRGAFTGADADRTGKFAEVGSGTLFLDEIDSLPPPLQAKLLRAVEERVFEPVGSNKAVRMQARLIVASNRLLAQEVAAGRFRADLFYRLNVVAFDLPPLRERKGVIPALARTFMAEFAARSGLRLQGIADDALQALRAYCWPGNIRELRNVIERAVALCPGPVIQLDDLPDAFHPIEPVAPPPAPAPVATPAADPAPCSLAQSKDQAERTRISQALQRNGNNRLRAAAELGISRMTLYNKLHKYGLIPAL